MYSVVLMAALTTGGASPDLFHHRGGCHGCSASYGCSGCYGGYGCSGCSGGYGYGCWSSCYCSGSYGGGWSSCAGSYGGYGCWSSCYCSGGYGCWSPYQCYSCYGGYGWMCSGCSGCSGCWGGSPYHPVITNVGPANPVAPGSVVPEGTAPKGTKPGETSGETSVRATLIVDLPADAKLFVDNVPMKTASSHRVFVTPPLQSGQTYYYVLKAEMQRDGQPVTVTGQVVIRPGQQVRAALSEPSPNGSFVVHYGNEQ